ncbi:uncharacterized protein M421DRAFT_374813 [Didymella exigua CBS 183.55]|uniref:Uncharacterized protein n=1 Tax=Didymella exigua CBS 183.55 TaxID=1150837 RepID=A0A6A5RVZ6_9PLEO|nr:uncharacterized protein M421DRAFT_374813 [Didymella exigua CBS 183.55]KAF1930456.1 hypothetical protein M421DRAFT_374813 [Didymella exigua CBS 183.55]
MSKLSGAHAKHDSLQPSRPLALSAELRNNIYGALFRIGEPKNLLMDVNSTDDFEVCGNDVSALRLHLPGAFALLLSCQQINNEAMEFLYSKFTFMATCEWILIPFTNRVFGRHDDFLYYILTKTTEWLHPICTQRRLVQDLRIDLRPMISYRLRAFCSSLNMARLLKYTFGPPYPSLCKRISSLNSLGVEGFTCRSSTYSYRVHKII